MSKDNIIPLFKNVKMREEGTPHDLPVTDVLEYFLYCTLVTGDRWGALAAFINLSTQLEGLDVTVSDELGRLVDEMDRDELARTLPAEVNDFRYPSR